MLRLAFALAGTLAVGACKLTPEEYAKIDRWLLCDDCRNGERDSVKAIGGKAVHTLDQALIRPSPGRIRNIETQARQTYRALSAPSVSEAAYVAAQRDNYLALYQRRAAVSLGDIGGSRALNALRRAQRDAQSRGYRADVIRVINTVLGSASWGRFAGQVRPNPAAWGQSVHVVRDSNTPAWDGNELVALYQALPSDSIALSRWPQVTDSFSFVALAESGPYALLVTGLGAPSDTQVATFTISAAPHPTHKPADAPTVTAALFPQTVQIAMGFRPGDTTDYYRFQPGADFAITALASSAPDVPTLRWFGCPPVDPLSVDSLAAGGTPGSLIGRVVDENSDPIAGAQVRIVGSALAVITNASGRFAFTPFPLAFVTPTELIRLRATRIGYGAFDELVHSGDSVVISLGGPSQLRYSGSSVFIPGGACRFLQVAIPSTDPHGRLVRLRLTSP